MSEETRLVGLWLGCDQRTRSLTSGPGSESPSGAQRKEVGAGGGKNVGELGYEKRSATLPSTDETLALCEGWSELRGRAFGSNF